MKSQPMVGHLLLWRHATAEDTAAGGDLARNLTRGGESEARQAAQWIEALSKRHKLKIKAIASPAARAKQTLAAFTDDMAIEPSIEPGARGDAYLEVARRWLSDKESALVLVGHQPSIGQAVAHLMFGAPASVSIKKGSVWWFVLRDDGPGEDGAVALRGVFSPD